MIRSGAYRNIFGEYKPIKGMNKAAGFDKIL